jgi:hypothetical protein
MFTLKSIKENNGGTISKATGEAVSYARGYQVSKRDLAIVKVRELRKRDLVATLNSLAEDECLGVWIDKGLAYIDCSEMINTKRQAMRVGKQRKQISVWNWKAQEAVYVR